MIFGFSEIPQKIEFISFSPEYREQTLDVIRKGFFLHETVAVASEIDKNIEGQNDLLKLCEDVLNKSNVTIIARDVEKDLIVGASLNVIQVILMNFLLEKFLLTKFHFHFQGQRTSK
jgi:hypothetical protein